MGSLHGKRRRPALLLPVMLVLSLAAAGCEPRSAPAPDGAAGAASEASTPAASAPASASSNARTTTEQAAADSPARDNDNTLDSNNAQDTNNAQENRTAQNNAARPDDETVQVLLKRHHCTSCHQTARKVVGPAFTAVAERYANTPNAQTELMQRIRRGGSGHWGPVPMPPQSQLNDDELQALAHWVLAQRPR